MEIFSVMCYNQLFSVVLLIMGVEFFTIFIILDLILLVICIVYGNLLIVSFLVLEFGVILYIVYN